MVSGESIVFRMHMKKVIQLWNTKAFEKENITIMSVTGYTEFICSNWQVEDSVIS